MTEVFKPKMGGTAKIVHSVPITVTTNNVNGDQVAATWERNNRPKIGTGNFITWLNLDLTNIHATFFGHGTTLQENRAKKEFMKWKLTSEVYSRISSNGQMMKWFIVIGFWENQVLFRDNWAIMNFRAALEKHYIFLSILSSFTHLSIDFENQFEHLGVKSITKSVIEQPIQVLVRPWNLVSSERSKVND